MIDIVNKIGLDEATIIKEAEHTSGEQLLEQDFALSRSMGVSAFPTIIVNENNKGVRIVGAQPLEVYVSGLQQVLQTQMLQAKSLPALAKLLEREGRLFSKEIEVMYNLKKDEVLTLIQQELSSDQFLLKEILGENYIEKK